MNENEITTGAAVDDIDDVEAHGMREVVVGLSAAAVLTGGAAAVMSSQGSGSGGTGTINATRAIDADADRVADGTSVASRGVAGPASFSRPDASVDSLAGTGVDAATDALRGTTDAADDVVSPNRTFMDRVDDRVDGTVDRARDVRDSVVKTAGNVVDTTRATVREEAREAVAAVREAPQTAQTTVRDLSSGTITTPNVKEIAQSTRRTVDATIALAGDTVRGISDGVMTTVARVQPGVGGEVSPQDASGWLTVTVGGQEIARAEVKDGQASVSWQAPSADLPVTFSYSGDELFSPASVTL